MIRTFGKKNRAKVAAEHYVSVVALVAHGNPVKLHTIASLIAVATMAFNNKTKRK